MKSPDEVFPLVDIDPDFPADGAVDLGKQGGWSHCERNPAHEGCGSETCDVPDDASAEGKHPGAPVRIRTEHGGINLQQGRVILKPLAVSDPDNGSWTKRFLNRALQHPAVKPPDLRIGDNDRGP